MNTDDVSHLKSARAALIRQQNDLARRIAEAELAPIALAEDLTKILVAIETVDRALADSGHPYFDADQ